MRSSLGVPTFLVVSYLPLHSQEQANSPRLWLEIGQGTVCDTPEQVQRFVGLRGDGMEVSVALQTVNNKSRGSTACDIALVAFTCQDLLIWTLVLLARHPSIACGLLEDLQDRLANTPPNLQGVVEPSSWTPKTTAQIPRTDFEQDRDHQREIAQARRLRSTVQSAYTGGCLGTRLAANRLQEGGLPETG
jgi:hypothetical protein